MLSIFSLFLDGGGMCYGMWVYVCATSMHTQWHAHTAYGVLRYEPRGRDNGVGTRHLESPKNSELNLGIYVFVYVNKVHTCMCICWEAG